MEFQRIIEEHGKRYPKMQPIDFGKLAYQSEFGPRHLGLSYEKAKEWMDREWQDSQLTRQECLTEEIGNGYVRLHFWRGAKNYEKELITRLFVLTAKASAGSMEGLLQRLDQIGQTVKETKDWLDAYRDEGCPVVSHSDCYRETYAPHYRLIYKKYADWLPLLRRTAELLQKKGRVLLSLDGCCGSGKTTCADMMKEVFGGTVLRMDDYYLPINKRVENWREIPTANMDLNRFRQEVLEPLNRGEPVRYRPYHCHSGSYGEETLLEPQALVIVEGSYSQHPELHSYYDETIFLTCSEELQRRRLMKREGDYFSMFEQCWIPLERKYHEKYQVREKADLIFESRE